MTVLRVGSSTDVGHRRQTNQDMMLVDERLFAVADGMGGHAGGEVAAATAVEALRDAFRAAPGARLEDAVVAANHAVVEKGQGRNDLRHMGTTLAAVALVEDGGEELFAVANVGDSRVYLLRDGELTQLTDDHSVPQELLRAGQLSEAEAAVDPRRNQLTRVLGMPDATPDMQNLVPYRGDRVLLCSDGLYNEVADADIAAVLRRVGDPGKAARPLGEMANANGGTDNHSVVVVDVVDDGDRAGAASARLGRSGGESRSGGGAGSSASGAGSSGSGAGAPGREAPASAPARRGGPGLMSSQERNDRLRGLATEEVDAADAVDAAHRRAFPAHGPPAEIHLPTRRISVRMLAFLLAVGLVLVGSVAAIGWYARASYFVGLDEGQVVTFKGRPGGLLWFKPTVAERSDLTMAQVLPSRVADLEAGKPEPTLAAARRYVANLAEEAGARAPEGGVVTGPGASTTLTTPTVPPVTSSTVAPTPP